jgi:hypothetical protein
MVSFEDVRVHPRGIRDEGIRGTLTLNGAGDTLSWAPGTQEDDTSRAYGFALALADVRSLRRAKAAPGSGVAGGVLTIVTLGGVALPPLYFHRVNGLVLFWRALTDTAHMHLTESVEDKGLFLVGQEPDQLSKSVMSFRLSASASPPEVVGGPAIANTSAAAAPSTLQPQEVTYTSTALADLQWLILGGFGSVKKFAEKTLAPRIAGTAPPPSTSAMPLRFPVPANHPTEVGGFDFVGEKAAATRDETAAAAAKLLESESLQHLPIGSRERPLTNTQWVALLDERGVMSQRNRVEFFRRAFFGGFSESIRAEAWKYLLGFYPAESTYEERIEIFRERTEQYYAIKNQWTAITKEQEKYCSKFV